MISVALAYCLIWVHPESWTGLTGFTGSRESSRLPFRAQSRLIPLLLPVIRPLAD